MTWIMSGPPKRGYAEMDSVLPPSPRRQQGWNRRPHNRLSRRRIETGERADPVSGMACLNWRELRPRLVSIGKR